MLVFEMHHRTDRDKVLREWDYAPDEGNYLGSMAAFQPGQADHIDHKYDVWLVDNSTTLLIQFGGHDGLCRTMPLSGAQKLAVLANNAPNQLWAYAYHMYLKREQAVG